MPARISWADPGSAPIDIKDSLGKTPLMTAVNFQNFSAVNLLLKQNADVEQVDITGTNVLEYAFAGRDNRIFALIFEQVPTACRTDEMLERYQSFKATQIASDVLDHSESLSEDKLRKFCEKPEAYELVIDPSYPQFDNSINQECAQKWIESHSAELQPLATKIIDNIHYIKFESFKEQLKICVEDFNKKLHSYEYQEYVLVLHEKEGKSNPWVFSHALRFLTKLPMDIVRINELEDYFDIYQDDAHINLLFVDDASYSGTQMKFDLDLANLAAKDRMIQVHCLIPFMTKRAYELLRAHNEAFLSSFQIIPTVKRLFNKDEKEILENNNVNSSDPGVIRYINWPEITLTYFQHKIADWKSTLTAILKDGRTIHDYRIKIPFIPWTIEPYKQEITLPIEIALLLRGDKYARGLPKATGNRLEIYLELNRC